MEPMLLTFFRILAALVGTLAFYVRLFMYEDEQGKWQNRIDNLWLTIDDRAKTTGSKTSAFFNRVSAVVNRILNRIFGLRLFSLRAVGASTCYSLAGACFSGFVAFAILLWINNPLSDPLPEELVKWGPLFESIIFVGGCIFLSLALLPSFFTSRWFVRLSLFPVFFSWMIGLPLELILGPLGPHGSHKHRQLAGSTALLASFLSDIFLVALVRFSIRWIAVKAGAFRIAVAVLLQAGVIILLIFVPFSVGTALVQKFGPSSNFGAVGMFALLNVFTGLTACTFLFVLLFVLLHKVLWPVLGRLLYPLARYEVIRNPKMLIGIGTVCYVFAFPLLPNALRSALEWLAR